MLHLYHANRLEDLAERLARDLQCPAGPVLAPQIVAVSSTAIGQWLSLQLAHHQGISANMQWLLPARLLWRVFRDVLSDVPKTNAFSAEVLAWRALAVLQDEAFVRDHGALAHYLADANALRFWQLARQMGRLFEQYLIFRPDWIHRWEHDGAKEWQGTLWRRLINNGDARHWLRLRTELFDDLSSNPSAAGRLPERLSLFALAGLSPAFLELLSRLAEHTDVHVYHLNFSGGFWADIVSDRERAHLIATQGEDVDAYLDRGNRLLASMGRLGREHLAQLLQLESIESETYCAPPRDTLLGAIQADIVELRDADEIVPFTGDPRDRSIQVHVCHGPMREIEILHDRLLDAFERDPDLTPADVRVLIPQLAEYAPLIESVFGAATGHRHIPWCLAERALDDHSPLVHAFLELLRLPEGRLDAQRVSALLDIPVLRRRFILDAADTEQVTRWIRELGIYWGPDAKALEEMDLPIGGTHTWRGATDRLLLGFALGDSDVPFADCMPMAPGDATLAQVAGRWRSFLEQLISLRETLALAHTLPEWIVLFHQVLEGFFLAGSTEVDNLVRLRQQLAALAADAALAPFDRPLLLCVIRDALEGRLHGASGGRFMSGGVTFATLAHGRCLPAKLLCLVGMNSEHFPGRDSGHGLDQMHSQFRPGDRRRRDDDRHAFLEALSCARSGLYISYTGASERDDSVQPPSVVISELLEQVDTLSEEGALSEVVTVRHPLQPFSSRYFRNEPNLFSYACEMVPPGDAGGLNPTPLFDQPLVPPTPGKLSLESLVDFLANPARSLLRDRLNVVLESGEGLLPTREPMWLDARSRRALARFTLQAQLQELDEAVLAQRARLEGYLPPGTPGELAMANEWHQVAPVAARLKPLMTSQVLSSWPVSATLGDWQLSGVLENVGSSGQILWSVESPSPWVILRVWCAHLLLNTDSQAPSHHTHLVSPDGVSTFAPENDPARLLSELLVIYSEGSCRPLPFFPRSAWKFVNAPRSPQSAAYAVWMGSEFSPAPGESANPYFALAFRSRLEQALDDEFESLALQLLGTPKERLQGQGL